MRKRIFLSFLTIVVFLNMAALTSCGKKKTESKKRIVTVVVEKIEKGSLDKFLKLNGTLVARNATGVYPDVPGKVASIKKFEGKEVKKDEVIMLIDRALIGANYKLSPVKSPVKGYITSLNVSIGSSVGPQMPVAAVGDIEQLDLHINVPERWVPEIKDGQEVIFSVPAMPGEEFIAKVYRKDYAINNMSQTLLVRATLPNHNKKLLPGMYADAAIRTRSAKNVFILPTSALVRMEDKTFVYVASLSGIPREAENENDKTNKGGEGKKETITALLKPINVLFIADTKAAVLEGLSENDDIVVFGKEFLTEGAPINAIREDVQ
ncbi:efflux RND transporter periplasmic adaptor subunit [Spirochaetota bacterium]